VLRAHGGGDTEAGTSCSQSGVNGEWREVFYIMDIFMKFHSILYFSNTEDAVN